MENVEHPHGRKNFIQKKWAKFRDEETEEEVELQQCIAQSKALKKMNALDAKAEDARLKADTRLIIATIAR